MKHTRLLLILGLLMLLAYSASQLAFWSIVSAFVTGVLLYAVVYAGIWIGRRL